MEDVKETCFNHVAPDKTISFCSSERRWINKIHKLKEKYPEDVNITLHEDDNWGMICAEIPFNWFRLSPPRHIEYTEEQKQAIVDRLSKARNSN